MRKFEVINDIDTILEMQRMKNNLNSQFKQIHANMTETMNMTIAKLMWKPEWKEKLDRAGRAANSYNLITRILNSISSIEISNRKKIKASAVSGGDVELNKVVTEVLLYYYDKCKYDFKRTRSTIMTMIAGLSVKHWNYDYENNPEGEMKCDLIDPRTVEYELINDPTWENISFIFRTHDLTIEDIINKYAIDDEEMLDYLMVEAEAFFTKDPKDRGKFISKKFKTLLSAAFEVATRGNNQLESQLNDRFNMWWNSVTGKFTVMELHEKRTERRLLIPDNEGRRLIDITEQTKDEKNEYKINREKVGMIKETYGLTGEPRPELAPVRYLTTVIPALNAKVNEQPYPFRSKTFCFTPQWCYDFHADAEHSHSIVDDLIDPQSDFNKARSTKLELLVKYGNPGWVMEDQAIAGFENDWTGTTMTPYRRVRPGYINRIKPEQHQTIPPDLIRETGESASLMKEISNADAIMGNADPNVKSGKFQITKERREEKSFAYLFENVDLADIIGWEYALRLIQHNDSIPKTFRITEDRELSINQREFAYDPAQNRIITKIKNDITSLDYDIKIDTTPYTTGARDMEFQQLMEIFEVVASFDPERARAMLPIIVESRGLAKGREILEAWGQQQGQSEQAMAMQQQMAQMMTVFQQIAAKLNIQLQQEDLAGKKLDNVKKAEEIKNMKQGREMNALHPNFGKTSSNGKRQRAYN
jgi:hypothetical protein